MSRIGRMPIAIPDGVTFTVTDNNVVTVKGPKGQLEKAFKNNVKIVKNDDNEVVIERNSDLKEDRAMHVVGVTEGYQKKLELNGVGYRASIQGNKLVMNLGFSHPVEVEALEGITFETPAPTKVIVKGIDKETVGAMAADIRKWRKPEPYLGKGIKFEGEHIRRKVGKTGK